MKITEFQRSLLIGARKHVDEMAEQFICHAVDQAFIDLKLSLATSPFDWCEKQALKTAISKGCWTKICNNNSFEGWLIDQDAWSSDESRWAFMDNPECVSVARVAWIDRILDTGEVL